jgi:hypothetical protein
MYSAFTDEVERYCHFPAPGRIYYNIGKLILLFLWSELGSYRENLVALGGELSVLAGNREVAVAFNFISERTVYR